MDAKTVFRTLAHETHPDHGGDAAKFREIVKVKSDFEALVRLANKWGIKIPSIDGSYTYKEKIEAVVGAIIRHSFDYKKDAHTLYGVIVNIRKITKGYHKGAQEFKIFDMESGTVWTLKTYEKQPFQEVVAMADISQLREGQRKLDNIKLYDKMKKQAAQTEANAHFARLGLSIGTNYTSKGVHVLVEYKGGKTVWERLIRTTPKSVYISHSGYKNGERRIPITSVLSKKLVY